MRPAAAWMDASVTVEGGAAGGFNAVLKRNLLPDKEKSHRLWERDGCSTFDCEIAC
jgi:hypothetical protein